MSAHHVLRGAAAALVFVACMGGAAAYAVEGQIEVLAFNVEPTWMYTGSPSAIPPVPPPHYVWNIPANDILNDGSVVEGMPGTRVWFIAPSFMMAPSAEIEWTGSLLDEDLSVGGVARATFQGGGTFSITGQLYDEYMTLICDGLLLQGTVSVFEVTEPHDTDTLTLERAIVTPTGGYLMANPYGLVMAGKYWLNGTVSAAQANGGGIDDFQSHIVTTAGFQWTLAQPEPTTALLLAGGLAFLAGRRRKAV